MLHRRPSQEQGRAGSPVHAAAVVVLPGIVLHHVQHASTGEWIAQSVEEASGCTGILKSVPSFELQDLGLYGGDQWVPLRCIYQRLEPAGWRLYIVVQKHDILAAGMLPGGVVASGIKQVDGQPNDLDLGESRSYPGSGPVCGIVVSEDDFQIWIGRERYGGKALLQ